MRWDLWCLGLRVCLCAADADGTVFLSPRDNLLGPAVGGEFPFICSTLGTLQCGLRFLFVEPSLQLRVVHFLEPEKHRLKNNHFHKRFKKNNHFHL